MATDLFFAFFFSAGAASVVLPVAPPFWQQDPPAEVVPLLQQEPLAPFEQDFSVFASVALVVETLPSVVSHFTPDFSHAALSASVHFFTSSFLGAFLSVLAVCAYELTPTKATRAMIANNFFILLFCLCLDSFFRKHFYFNCEVKVAIVWRK